MKFKLTGTICFKKNSSDLHLNTGQTHFQESLPLSDFYENSVNSKQQYTIFKPKQLNIFPNCYFESTDRPKFKLIASDKLHWNNLILLIKASSHQMLSQTARYDSYPCTQMMLTHKTKQATMNKLFYCCLQRRPSHGK